jgi:hypothetical protein
LTDEDVAFVKRFVLASGSLKALAKDYGVSYPTIRLRLDLLIQKIGIYDSEEIASAFERELRAMVAEGKLDVATMNAILAAHERELEEEKS